MTGRRMPAPCGHDGVCVIGSYVACLRPNCDGAASTGPRCDRCGSGQLEPFSAPFVPTGATRCVPCGRVWWGGVGADEEG